MKAFAVAVDPTVTLEMSLKEAEMLRALVGGIKVQTTGRAAKFVKDTYAALKAAGVEGGTQTYSDHFKGEVETKAVKE